MVGGARDRTVFVCMYVVRKLVLDKYLKSIRSVKQEGKLIHIHMNIWMDGDLSH